MIDADVHFRWSGIEEIAPYFEEPWRSQLRMGRRPFGWNGYFNPIGSRRPDLVTPSGGAPGSDPDFTLRDLEARHGPLDHAVLMGESSHLALSNLTNPDWAAAVARAYNDWMIERWLAADPRYLGSLFVAAQDPEAAAREIERVGGHPQVVQVVLGSGARAPYGQRVYRPIHAAAERMGLPLAIHVASDGAGTAAPPTSAGYPSHYIEWQTNLPATLQAHLVSFLCEGVFEAHPGLRLVLVEGGFAWLPLLMWRLDREWRSLRREVPWMTRPPSEVAFEHLHLTTQPMEEVPEPAQLHQILAMFPAERMLLFSSDYPHWDGDDPRQALAALPSGMRDAVADGNARALYGLPPRSAGMGSEG